MPRLTLDPDTATSRLISQLLVSLLRNAPRVALASLSVIDAHNPYHPLTSRTRLSKRLTALARHMALLGPVPDHLAPPVGFNALVCPVADPFGDRVGGYFWCSASVTAPRNVPNCRI